ncbi:MAG TPA: hypothetical protein VMG12_34700 [Polyangiaceae bacterium]|nr:hypothetical protein [Polyangiaceae bacterium]
MWVRMMLPVGALLGVGGLGCSLNLDFDRFEFSDPDAAMGRGSAGSPAVAAQPSPEAPGRCPAGARECVGEGLSVELPATDSMDVDETSRRDAGDGDVRPPAVADAATEGPRTCDRCTPDENCALGICQPAATSCAALEELDPTLRDGIYSITTSGIPRRTYCDMTARVALCSDGDPADHEGVTRGATQLPFVLTSVLEGNECRVWNVRARTDGLPVDGRATDASGNTVLPCTPLGFASDPPGYDETAGCRYGINGGYGTCGFDVTRPLFKWSNLCECQRVGVDMNPGFFADQHVLQGEIFASIIPWDATGSISVLCGT